jgi:hypothetical protein
MGCDIHMVLQKRQPDNTWKTVEKSLYSDRNYRLFEALAGVRGSDSVWTPRGLPKDLAHIGTEDPMIDDVWLGSHSFGFLHLDTYFGTKMTTRQGLALSPLTESLVDHLDYSNYDGDLNDLRIVFGFDS